MIYVLNPTEDNVDCGVTNKGKYEDVSWLRSQITTQLKTRIVTSLTDFYTVQLIDGELLVSLAQRRG